MNSYTILKIKQLGELLLVANPTHLTGVYFHDCEHAPTIAGDWERNPGQSILQQAAEELQEYLAGGRTEFSVPVRAAGTPFQEEIWRQIALIPFGGTITYSELARRAEAVDAVRAAGAATGRNPISIIVPCHRVIGKNGAITGYAGGLNRKRFLLEVESNDGNLKLRLVAAVAEN